MWIQLGLGTGSSEKRDICILSKYYQQIIAHLNNNLLIYKTLLM